MLLFGITVKIKVYKAVTSENEIACAEAAEGNSETVRNINVIHSITIFIKAEYKAKSLSPPSGEERDFLS